MKPPVFDPTWTSEIRALYKHDIEEIWDRTLAPHIWNAYHNQLRVYKEFAEGGDKVILDIGCAQGTLALQLSEMGHDVTAVDLRPEFLKYARSRYTHGAIRFIEANALSDEIPGEYDLIYANQIIEHLVYPQEFVSRLSALLRPGGRLVVATPNFDYIKNKLPSFRQLGEPSKWEHMQFTADGDGHFFAYSSAEMAEIFLASSLKNVRVQAFESPFISGHMKVRYLHSIVPCGLLARLDSALLQFKFLASKLGHQLLATGTKPD